MPGMSFPHTPEQQHPEQPGAVQFVAQPAPPKPKRAGMIALAAAGVLLLMAGAGLGVWYVTRPDATPSAAAGAASPSTLDVTGVITLQRGQFTWNSVDDPTCQGWKGFEDLRAGAQVTVTDAAGKTLAVGAISAGTAQGITTEADGMHRAGSCMLPFKAAGVARGAGPYGVEVAHRGVLRYNEGDLGGLMLGFS